MKTDPIDHIRNAKQRGDLDGYLDSIGRSRAEHVAPEFVAAAVLAFEFVPAAHSSKGGAAAAKRQAELKRDPNNRTSQPDLFDATGNPEQLVSQMTYVEYEVGGKVYAREELIQRPELLAQLAEKRRAEGDYWEQQEDRARRNKYDAWKDANILDVVLERLFSMAAE